MISLYNFLYISYIRKHWLWFSYWFPLNSESGIAYLSDFPCCVTIWMEPEKCYFAFFPYSVKIFSFSCWLELNKNALKSRFLLWWANLKINFLGDEGGGQALGNLKESKLSNFFKIVKIAKNEKMKKCSQIVISLVMSRFW